MPGNCSSLQKWWRLFRNPVGSCVILLQHKTREDEVCIFPGTAIFSHQCWEYEHLFTGMFTNILGVDVHVCITKCKIIMSHHFFCPISVIWRYDCATVGANLWTGQCNVKKNSKVHSKAFFIVEILEKCWWEAPFSPVTRWRGRDRDTAKR